MFYTKILFSKNFARVKKMTNIRYGMIMMIYGDNVAKEKNYIRDRENSANLFCGYKTKTGYLALIIFSCPGQLNS